MSRCPACHQPVKAELGEVRMDEDGAPIACAMKSGFGVPVLSRLTSHRVFLDGAPVAALGFDRESGIVWRYQRGADGNYLRRGDGFVIEQVAGTVTLERVA